MVSWFSRNLKPLVSRLASRRLGPASSNIFRGEEVERKFHHLQRLIKRADLAGVRGMLDSGVSANLQNKRGYSLLMLSAVAGNVALGELLISRGADTNHESSQGSTAVGLAVIGGHVPFLQMLLERGAKADCTLNGILIEKWVPSCQFGERKESIILDLLEAYRSSVLGQKR